MRFIKFVTKTIIASGICAFMFSTVLERTLSSQAKEDIKNASENIVNLLSVDDKTSKNTVNKEILSDEELVKKDEGLVKEDKELIKEDEELVKKEEIPENILTNKSDNFIFIGDSRTVAYKEIVDIDKYDFITFISEESKGYDWLNETAIEKLNTRFDTTDLTYNVVLNLGINDLNNVDKYIDIYNELAEKNTKHNFFVIPINKVDSEKMMKNGYNVIENSEIEEFNSKMKSSLSENIHFIDTYSYFKDKDLETNDGVHYTDNSSNKILNYISDYIKSL